MIYQKNYLQINSNQQEFPNVGQQNQIDFAAYKGNMHDSVVPDYIPAHWHHELEIFYVEDGMINATVKGEIYHLCAGDSCSRAPAWDFHILHPPASAWTWLHMTEVETVFHSPPPHPLPLLSLEYLGNCVQMRVIMGL